MDDLGGPPFMEPPKYFHVFSLITCVRNAPANIIDPITLTAAAADMAKQLGLSAKILDEKELGLGQINLFLDILQLIHYMDHDTNHDDESAP